MKTNTPETPSKDEVRRTCCASNLLPFLWDRTNENLSDQDLEWLSSVTDCTIMDLFNLNEVTEAIGCLVSTDGMKSGGDCSGNFQSADEVATLLFTIGRAQSHIHSSLSVSMYAQDLLDRRKRDKK